ncbi:MAG: DUF192 domain-containing protein [Chloroflexi bacterium]|nr:DUF192 domain-containing protein [Chloroflexota bacterium]
MRLRLLVPALVALLLVGCGALSLGEDAGGSVSPTNSAGPRVLFPTVGVDVELARTDAQRAKGLGGHAPLGPREGMLFIFERRDIHAFWMKGMTFPLDIMWIDDGKVVHLENDVPPPAPGQAEATLPVYAPPVPARYVLEGNAGFARRHGITVGTPVQTIGI